MDGGRCVCVRRGESAGRTKSEQLAAALLLRVGSTTARHNHCLDGGVKNLLQALLCQRRTLHVLDRANLLGQMMALHQEIEVKKHTRIERGALNS
jgi:hypothetical protein